jgi:hypothetical protein
MRADVAFSRETKCSKGGGDGRGVLSDPPAGDCPARYGIVDHTWRVWRIKSMKRKGRRVNVEMWCGRLGALLRAAEGNWKTDPSGCWLDEPARVGGESESLAGDALGC